MLNLVPFARAWRQVAEGESQTRLISQLLEFPFPQAHPRAVAASTIGTDQQPLRSRILRPAQLVPPSADAFHRKGGRIVVDDHSDPARVASQVVDAIGSSSAQTGDGEVIDPHLLWFSLGMPFTPPVLEIAHQFLLLCIDRDDWFPRCQAGFCLTIEVLELRIPIRVLASLTRLAISLQAVAQRVQQLTHQLMRHLVAYALELLGQFAHTLARPAQRGLWVSPRHRLHQPFQVLPQPWLFAHCGLAPTSLAADPSLTHFFPLSHFPDPLPHALPP